MIVVSNDVTTTMSNTTTTMSTTTTTMSTTTTTTNRPAIEPTGTTCTGIHNVCNYVYVCDIQWENLVVEMFGNVTFMSILQGKGIAT